jgi:hypothetical protein
MRRIPFDIIITLLLGLGLGLAYSWLFSPLHVVDASPVALRADFKDAYRSAIAASYGATNNLARAQARLALLGDPNSIDALNSQAQRLIASGEFAQADRVVALAIALENGTIVVAAPTFTSTADNAVTVVKEATATLPPPPPDLPFQFTETPQSIDPQIIETQPVINTATPRPTRTLIPTVGAPFALIAQDTVCDATLPDGLLQVLVFNSNRKQIAGAKIIITWANGEEQFFTGLKPEISHGYADYSMSPNIAYTVRLASGSDIASELTAPTCQTPSGETFIGGIKLTFQQP